MIYTRNTCIILVKKEVFFLSIGDNIKRIREAKGISQYKLAQMLNISQQSVDQWERSLTNPRKSNIDKISSILNVSVNELFGDADTNITAQRLRELREAKGLSQNEVAKLIGVTRTAYLHYETGRYKPVRKIKELCNLFNVTSDYILGTDVETVDKKEVDKKKPADLEKFLNQSEVMFDGEVMKLDEEDRQEIRNALEFIFYKAKKKNKRKK